MSRCSRSLVAKLLVAVPFFFCTIVYREESNEHGLMNGVSVKIAAGVDISSGLCKKMGARLRELCFGEKRKQGVGFSFSLLLCSLFSPRVLGDFFAESCP